MFKSTYNGQFKDKNKKKILSLGFYNFCFAQFIPNTMIPFDPYLICDSNYNLGHNVLRHFDMLPNFPFTTSKMKHDYY